MKHESHNPKEPNDILASIKNKHIVPKSKGYFVFLTGLTIVGVIVIALAVLYVASLVLFSMQQSGAWFLPGFGFSALGVFLGSLPWLLLLALLILVIVVAILARRYSFAYGQPILYFAIALILFVAIGGCLINQTELHSSLMNQSSDRRFPAAALYHRFADERMPRIIPCTVVERTAQGYVARNEHNQLINVIISKRDNAQLNEFQPGDVIAIMGDCEGMTIRAEAIHKIDRLPFMSATIKKRPSPCDF